MFDRKIALVLAYYPDVNIPPELSVRFRFTARFYHDERVNILA